MSYNKVDDKKIELISKPKGDKSDPTFSILIFGMREIIKRNNMIYNNLDQKRAFKTALKKFLVDLEKIDRDTMLGNKLESWFSFLLKFKKYTSDLIEYYKNMGIK